MATKHEQILMHIQSLSVGTRISVRRIARDLNVSEGTAYRAIKEAEIRGLVSAMDRIGTVRIERKEKKNIERLTFAEVVNIVQGTVLGGKDGLHKTLHKFVIGAMQVGAIIRYIEHGSLMLVGNREQVQRLSLENGAAVLITGGFDASDEIVQLANEHQLPLISCTYDTFTTATLINRAIYDRLIKKEILFVEDIVAKQELALLRSGSTVRDYLALVEQTGHARVPVVDARDHVIGVLTARDVADAKPETEVDTLMSKHPSSVSLKTTVASAAHRMVWEGIELLPVIQNRRLVGVLSRQDVLKALQSMNHQPQVGDTLADMVVAGFEEVRHVDERMLSLFGTITPQMTSSAGILATGSLTTLIEYAAVLCVRRQRRAEMVVENMTFYSFKPVSVDAEIEVRCRLLDHGRRFAKVDVEVFDHGEPSAKALLTTQILER